MKKQILTGNEAIARGALAAGAKVITGYPGTPSSEVIGSLLKEKELTGVKVEWSVNEKIAFEIAAAAAWTGQRALCTMKMSGLNVAYDSLISAAYSGCRGGLVIYVADDPGVSTGMCEQDSRGFALISDMPMLEPASVAQAYDLTVFAFRLSEAIGSPVFLRGVTNIAQSHAPVEMQEHELPPEKPVSLPKDIATYTKAGAIICQNQHFALLQSLDEAEVMLRKEKMDTLILGKKRGLGIIGVGVAASYIDEAIDLAREQGFSQEDADISYLQLCHTLPYPTEEISTMLGHCGRLLILEELEPHLERRVYLQAYQEKQNVQIWGKENGVFSRSGEYNAALITQALLTMEGISLPEDIERPNPARLCAARPITTCAGCPHRGTFLAINKALRKAGVKQSEALVTGDIGCTILGMNAPFNTLWTELSMGASIGLAQGFIYAGIKTPMVATIGDSTFFHAGLPALVNVVQHNINMTVVIMDNGWTAMTGMQTNPGTDEAHQAAGKKQIDIELLCRGMGVEQVLVADPYDLPQATEAMSAAIAHFGPSVVLMRRECAIQSGRRKISYGDLVLDNEKCTLCKACINQCGCPALSLEGGALVLDKNQCNGCGVCKSICKFGALSLNAE
ncbi:MAG: thiamine pyrophosphate-dependent enzyme [Clostridiales bacterium]|jgi:indolepyruvate ferredoxin oxidoreductase alpha subunit|nr:thiamine pyrophosphate-dependent enzyme [Clostridiales bacterium]MDR2713027.1 4Fe-4S binding protein [Clostridiales bacterium]